MDIVRGTVVAVSCRTPLLLQRKPLQQQKMAEAGQMALGEDKI